MVVIYIPENEEIPIPSYVEEKFIEVTRNEPEQYVTIERKECACNTKDGIAVFNDNMIIQKQDLYVTGCSNYRILYNSETEFINAVFWLVKSKFYTFVNYYGYYYSHRTQSMQKTLKRRLSPRFYTMTKLQCGCIQYYLGESIVYCLRNIVLSGKKKGPTIESVI